MDMQTLLRQHQEQIKERWIELIIGTYPPESSEFFRRQKNRFLNPVGAALSKQVDSLYGLLLSETPAESLSTEIKDFIKVRAVQDFAPAQAVGFILYLKQAIRERLADEIITHGLFAELLALETNVDQLMLAAFDFYMQSREKIFRLKADEVRRQAYLALRQAGVNYPGMSQVDIGTENEEICSSSCCGGNGQ